MTVSISNNISPLKCISTSARNSKFSDYFGYIPIISGGSPFIFNVLIFISSKKSSGSSLKDFHNIFFILERNNSSGLSFHSLKKTFNNLKLYIYILFNKNYANFQLFLLLK